MKYITFLVLSFMISCCVVAQNYPVKLSKEQKENLKAEILFKIKELASLIDNLSSTNSSLTFEQKLTEIKKGEYLFYKFNHRYIYLTSPKYPQGQRRKIRDYFHNLIRLSLKYPLLKIEWSEFFIPMNNSSFRFIGYSDSGEMIYSGKVHFKQIFIEYNYDYLSRKETPSFIRAIEDMDHKTAEIQITRKLIIVDDKWKEFYSIKICDIHATLLQHNSDL